ncbi:MULTISPECIES: transposase [Burkholderia]|uniref:transposase n=1 Tax=Burkholderia TaxID=32008 RepID=UPI00084216A5|nr:MULTISPECIES: transposase [unclassified Burkholderia]AOK31268.1 hypothetical protein AQ611_16795 [Burkholderia sp. Bp7605]
MQACLKPGVSIAQMVMEYGINPNLVWTWISQYQREQGGEIAGLPREPPYETYIELSMVPV